MKLSQREPLQSYRNRSNRGWRVLLISVLTLHLLTLAVYLAAYWWHVVHGVWTDAALLVCSVLHLAGLSVLAVLAGMHRKRTVIFALCGYCALLLLGLVLLAAGAVWMPLSWCLIPGALLAAPVLALSEFVPVLAAVYGVIALGVFVVAWRNF